VPHADASGSTAVRRLGALRGETLTTARPSYDQNNEPIVEITFDSQAA
jgi:preprotein translocase subunit SecD